MNKRSDYVILLNDLKSSQNEVDVVNIITKIVKGFTSDIYKSDLLENPYFKSIFYEVKSSVYSELIDIKKSLLEEISAIDGEILKLNGLVSKNKQISKLCQLKSDCLLLISELELRLSDLITL